MENISYVGLSQQVALQQQLEITANNLANMTTPGFKSQNVLFQDYLSKPKNDEDVHQVINYGTYRDLTAGSFSQTNNPLDMAIENNEGYFTIRTPEGIRYTRDGSFTLDAQGQLVTKQGYPVMGEGDVPITIPEEATRITVTKEGEISTDQGALAVLKVVDFNNPQKLQRMGENLYTSGGEAEIPVENVRISQGLLEGSNVNPILEMNKMIEITRLFKATQNMLQSDHERIRGTIQKLTKS